MPQLGGRQESLHRKRKVIGGMMQPDIRSGVLRAFDAANYVATVQVTGSLHRSLTGVAVARNIAAAEMTAGRRVAVALFDPANPSDGVLFAVWP